MKKYYRMQRLIAKKKKYDIYVSLFRYYFHSILVESGGKQERTKEKTCFNLMNTKIAMDTKEKMVGIFLIILLYIKYK